MKGKLRTIKHRLSVAAMSLFGFTSTCCFYTAYGCPTIDFQADGRITDEEGYPIEGIEINAKFLDDTNEYPVIYSDEDGRFSTEIFKDKYLISLIATDIDGEKNGGEFETKEIDLTKMTPEIRESKKDEWYSFRIYRDVKIQLAKKSSNEEEVTENE